MSFRRRWQATAAALTVAAVVVLAAMAWLSNRPQPAPAVSYTLLDGSTRTTDDLKGKVVLINFWATSCVSCVKEMPQLAATHEKFKARGFDTLAVSMQYDPPARVALFAETRRLPFGVAIDNTGSIARSYGDVAVTPTTFLVNRRGDIVQRYVGTPDFAALHMLLDRLLAEG